MNDKIIIVDDEKEIADLLDLYLTNDGFSVSKAFNAKDALDLVEAENFDLMILDIMLEDMDGFSVCKKNPREALFSNHYVNFKNRFK